MSTAFTSDECNVLAEALDMAWDICLRSGRLRTLDVDLIKSVLTRSIMIEYEGGERDVRRLALAAAAHLQVAQPPITTSPPTTPAA